MPMCLREFGYEYSSDMADYVPSVAVVYGPGSGSLTILSLLGSADDIARATFDPSAIIPVTRIRREQTWPLSRVTITADCRTPVSSGGGDRRSRPIVTPHTRRKSAVR